MRHVSGIADAGTWDGAPAADRVVLDAADRVRRRIVLTTKKGQKLLLDFPEPMMLRDGDGLVLDDGSVVVVAGGRAWPRSAPRRRSISCGSPGISATAHRWQLAGKAFRIRRDHVLEEMVKGLGAVTTEVEAPFDPEPAAPHARRTIMSSNDGRTPKARSTA